MISIVKTTHQVFAPLPFAWALLTLSSCRDRPRKTQLLKTSDIKDFGFSEGSKAKCFGIGWWSEYFFLCVDVLKAWGMARGLPEEHLCSLGPVLPLEPCSYQAQQ